MPAQKEKQPTLRDIYRQRSKELDKEVEQHIKDSEHSGNTLDDKHFDTYLRDMVEKYMSEPTGLPESDNTIISNTLYNHAHIDLKSKYRSSLKLKPRTPNNKLPISVSKEWQETAKKQLKTVRGGIRDKAKEVLRQSQESGRTPTQKQYLDYLSGQMNTVIEDMPEDYQDYVRAYAQEWINTTARDLYDSNLKENPRKVTGDFPWTKTPREDQYPSPKGLNTAQEAFLNAPMTEYGDTYRSFSGHDMVCTIDMPMPDGSTINQVIGSLQTVTYSIHDEKMPIRCIGDMNAKGYVFGPRTIAGTLIFTVFDRHWLKKIMDSYLSNSRVAAHFLSDELPPFNMTISCANEYGYNARLAIYGITLVNEGQVMSINDVYTENTYQFYALDIDYLSDVTSKAANTTGKDLPTASGGDDNQRNPKVVYLDDAAAEADKKRQQELDDNVSKSTDPDKPSTHDSDYYVGTSKDAMYSAIRTSRDKTDEDLVAKYNKGEISADEFQRLRTKNLENYQNRMEKAANYYEKTSTGKKDDSRSASGKSDTPSKPQEPSKPNKPVDDMKLPPMPPSTNDKDPYDLTYAAVKPSKQEALDYLDRQYEAARKDAEKNYTGQERALRIRALKVMLDAKKAQTQKYFDTKESIEKGASA